MVISGEVEEWQRGVGEWEIQIIGCKIGYKNVLFTMENIVNIL